MKKRDSGNLEKLLVKYRFPNGISDSSISYKDMYKKMKLDNTLPTTWKSPFSIAKFMERHEISSGGYKSDWLTRIIIPILDNVEIDIKARFHIFWSRLNEDEKKEFFRTIGNLILFTGINKSQVCAEIVNNFKDKGFLHTDILRKYVADEFKNTQTQERRYSTRKKPKSNIINSEVNSARHELIQKVLKELGVNSRGEFKVLWFDMHDKKEREEFIRKICHKLLNKGIAVTSICSLISNGLAEMGWLNENSLRFYCPNEFKDQEHAERKIGKTFEVSGRKRKDEK